MEQPRILVLYYTQSGQLKTILDSILKEVKDHAAIDFAAITPQAPFPFPWSPHSFFDAMPETVLHIPSPIQKLPPSLFEKEYDLVILGYQPWYLNPSQPITAFLQSDDAKILENKKVLTVIGSRNMWLHAQEKVKGYLLKRKAQLVGNIVLFDTNTNIISTLTVIRWAFTGKKEASGWLPEAGVQQKDIQEAARFGATILKTIQTKDWHSLQEKLLQQNAIVLDPGLVLLEQRGIKNFRYWAKFIREKGGPGDVNRKGRVTLFRRLLIVGIFILSPLSSLSAFIKLQLHKKKLANDVVYFKQLELEEGRM